MNYSSDFTYLNSAELYVLYIRASFSPPGLCSQPLPISDIFEHIDLQQDLTVTDSDVCVVLCWYLWRSLKKV